MTARSRVASRLQCCWSALLVGAVALVVAQHSSGPTGSPRTSPQPPGSIPATRFGCLGSRSAPSSAIEPDGPARPRLTLDVDRDVPIPADAKAIIVSQNLVAARYVQLTPAYHKRQGGPTLHDGAVIPIDRTAVPVEWDEVKYPTHQAGNRSWAQANDVSIDVGRSRSSTAPPTRWNGNGDKLRQTLAQLSGVGRILADGSGNIVDTIKNLQTFVSALRDSKQQIVQFQNRLATLSSVLDDSRSDLDAALTDLSVAIVEVQRFIAGTRDKTAEQLARAHQRHPDPRRPPHGCGEHPARRTDRILQRLQHLPPQRSRRHRQLHHQQLLQSRPSASAARWAPSKTSPPAKQESCAANTPGRRSAQLNFNLLPIPMNPVLQRSATPDKIIYAEPRLAPGGEGPAPSPPETPPAVSAYTGLGDPGAKTLPEMMLPAERPGPPPGPPPAGPQTNGAPPP